MAGNVLTSQRVTDVILRAFEVCAASQGCMNNLTMGDNEVSTYETIAGGAGAGPSWHGCSGVHTHMTKSVRTDHVALFCSLLLPCFPEHSFRAHRRCCPLFARCVVSTRITDPEVLEARFPVVLCQFSLRPGSGGAGCFRGGDGVVREIEFLRPLTVNILSERRVHAPWGLHGGGDGKRGVNRWYSSWWADNQPGRQKLVPG